jgi:hypothetical protein
MSMELIPPSYKDRNKNYERKYKSNTLEFGKKHSKCVSGIKSTFVATNKRN